MSGTYNIGNVVKCYTSTSFSLNGVPTDPDIVNFICAMADGTYVRAVYPTDTTVVKDGTGLYHRNVTANISGTYTYRFYCLTGPVQGSSQGTFTVTQPVNVEPVPMSVGDAVYAGVTAGDVLGP